MISSFFAAALLVAQTPAPAGGGEMAEQVRILVRELDAPQRVTREEAERKLSALGPQALEHLAKLPAGASAEVVTRVNRVRAALYRERAAASLAGARVTLDVQAAPLGEVLAEFEKQTGNRLYDFRRQFGQLAEPIDVTLKLDGVLFWQAVDALCTAARLEVYHFSGTDGLALVAAGEEIVAAEATPRPVVYAGAFRLEAMRLVASREAAGAQSGELQIVWETAWEPRLKPLFFTVTAARLAAVDDKGDPLRPRNSELVVELPPQGKACRVEMTAVYHSPRRGAERLAELKGSVDVLLPAELHTFRFPDIGRSDPTEQRAGAVSVALDRPREAEGVVGVPVRIKYDDAANALESHRAWFYKNPARLETADGVATDPSSIELLRQAANELTLNLIFAPEGDWRARTLVYATPADIVVLPIEFTFKDLPLP